MKLQITFKSGAQVAVDVTDFTLERSRVTSELVTLRWTTPAEATSSLSYVNLIEVAAVIRLDPEDGAS